MIYTALTKKALRLCFESHKDQTDKSGLTRMDEITPYALTQNEKYKKAAAILRGED